MTKSNFFILGLLLLALILGAGFLFFYGFSGTEFRKTLKEDFSKSLRVETEKLRLPLAKDRPFPLGAQEKIADEIQITAESAVILDNETGHVLYQKNCLKSSPIASLSKLISAMLILEKGLDLNKPLAMISEDYIPGGKLQIAPGETVTIKDHIYAMLTGSANNSTVALVREAGYSYEGFIKKMNERAQEFNLPNTVFYSASGLDPRNKSNAYEVARFAREAFKNKFIREASIAPEYTMITLNTNREHTIQNTNELVRLQKYKIAGSKTGYLDEAGYCLVTQVEIDGKGYTIVILNSPSKPAHFSDMEKLIQWLSTKIRY